MGSWFQEAEYGIIHGVGKPRGVRLPGLYPLYPARCCCEVTKGRISPEAGIEPAPGDLLLVTGMVTSDAAFTLLDGKQVDVP
jgi:hypothetical protein